MGLLSLIKKFVNEGEVSEEELTGDLAVDPIASYEASTNVQKKTRTQYIVADKDQTVQKARKTTKSAEATKTQRARKTVEVQENDEPEL